MNAPQSIVFETTDGAERRFSLSNKKFMRMEQEKLRTEPGIEQGLDILWMCCDDKDDLKREDFINLFPITDLDLINGLVKAVTDEWTEKNKPRPANEKFRPTKAETQPSDGSGLPPSGELTLVA